MNLSGCGVALALLLVGAVPIVYSIPAVGTPTRFVTDKLPEQNSPSTVLSSRNGNFMASVANGYVGTVIYSDTVHVSGVYNGKAYQKKYPIYPIDLYEHPHRARIPSTASLNFKIRKTPGNTSYALDVYEGVFYKWFEAVNLTVEQRIYAHRTRKNLLIVELTAKNNAGREFLMDLTPNMGYITQDIDFYMKESNRAEALAGVGLVCFIFMFSYLIALFQL